MLKIRNSSTNFLFWAGFDQGIEEWGGGGMEIVFTFGGVFRKKVIEYTASRGVTSNSINRMPGSSIGFHDYQAIKEIGNNDAMMH